MLRRIFFVLVGMVCGRSHAAELRFEFSQHKVNEPPPEFRSVVSGLGKPGDWRIVMDQTPPLAGKLSPVPAGSQRAVLAQLSRDATDEHFPMLIYEGGIFSDFTFTTRFKTVGGAVEQMAGIAFRIQDETNYYVLRASSLGNTFKFYKVVNGQRGALLGPEIEIAPGVWHQMSVTCEGNSIRCSLDGQPAIPPLNDSTFSSGKVGFWTKSDSVSYFSDAQVDYRPRQILAETLIQETMKKNPRLLGLRIYAARTNSSTAQVVASSLPKEVGVLAEKVEGDVIARGTIYYGKSKGRALVTLPLRDRNGEAIAAVRVTLKALPVQTEQNAVARAWPIVRQMEARARSVKELLE
jgi:hypothetical protein